MHASIKCSSVPGSPLTPAVSSAVIKLKEDGTIAKLKKKWWKKQGGEECGVRLRTGHRKFMINHTR